MMRLILLLPLAALAGCDRPAADCSGLSVSDAWVRAAPPGADVTAGYFVVENHGEAPVLLTGAASPEFERVEIHRSRQMGGRTAMIPISALEIVPGESEAFAPGSFHLMLFGAGDLSPGDGVRLELICGDNGGRLEVAAEVRTGMPGGHSRGHGGGHGHGSGG